MSLSELDVLNNLSKIFKEKNWPLNEDPRNERSLFNRFAARFSLFKPEHQSLLLELTSRFEIIEKRIYPTELHRAFEKIDNSIIDNVADIFILPVKPNKTNSSIAIWLSYKDWFVDLTLPYSHKFRFKGDFSFLTKRTNFSDCIFVFVDDYIGSGDTINTEIQKFLTDYTSKGVTKDNIHVICIAGQEEGMKNLTDNDINCYVSILFKKGISDYYIGDDVIVKKNQMLDIEKKLLIKPELNLGQNQSEALVSFSKKPPNNTFPVFWHETKTKIAPLPRYLNYGQED